ncbi:cell wall-binding protein [Enterocloster asparagiformis]|uniref:Cell wall-binding repeat protein n=3 Tax=Enterocloster asparagiformis TaxID=333367 RepID=C0DBQ0_9FIRM|nr:cell wall-binding protein [Enterocloster asparagiformis]EEG51227.1 cell wall-binding repeat protein [[Clostridium] asparagiforme DSM 15981]RGX20857.1 cell wall-binding protein [Enterocloster asparagiformis]UWO76006.1 cell wall-binding protein [[Clostridium] asparagiforme DSM 15981]
MRKQTKLVAVLSTAALLAIGASMTSFAAQGWAEEDGTWVYYDSSNDRVTEEWKKSGDNWYWLDDNGEMAVDMLVEDDDDYYYVDANGVMVTNQWVAIENEDAGEEDEPDHYWYYFQANGKAYTRSDNASEDSVSAKTINGKKYAFDEEGRMLYGWVSGGERQTDDDAWKESLYYFGDEDDGAMSLGWRQISIVDDEYEDLQPGDEYWDEDQDRWFYFQTSGKKVAADSDDGDTLKTKTINGRKYGFDEYGRMIADWFTETASYSTATQGVASYTSSFMYFSTPEDGARATKGWFKVVPGYYLHEDKYNDGDDYWYYADGDGEIYSNVIKTIKGKKYAFDNYGRMIDGLVFLQMATENGKVDSSEIAQKFADDGDIPYDTEDAFDDFVVHYAPQISSGEIRSFYFGDSDDGAMKTGRQTVEIDGDSFTFKFKDSSSSKGAGINGIDDHKLYSAGKLIEADSDDKYQVVIYSEDEDGIVTMEKMDTDDFLTEYCHELEAGDKDYDEDATTWNVNDDIDSSVKLYLVNTSGSMVKNKSAAKDGEDYKFNVKNYQITQVVLED